MREEPEDEEEEEKMTDKRRTKCRERKEEFGREDE